MTDAIHKSWLCWLHSPVNTTPGLFVCPSGLLVEAPPSPRTLRLPLKRLGDGWVFLGWSTKARKRGGEEGDRQMIGKIHCSLGDVHPLPLSSLQCHQLLLSNQWLSRVKTHQKREKGGKKKIQSPAERRLDLQTTESMATELRSFRTKTCSCEEQKRGLTGERKEKMGPYRLLHSGATKSLLHIQIGWANNTIQTYVWIITHVWWYNVPAWD